jgi:hypothetical protein
MISIRLGYMTLDYNIAVSLSSTDVPENVVLKSDEGLYFLASSGFEWYGNGSKGLILIFDGMVILNTSKFELTRLKCIGFPVDF